MSRKEPFLNQFRGFYTSQGLFKEQETILIACSGGVDSMVLAHCFHTLEQPFAIAHVNYNLRGEDSKLDAAHVELYAKQWAVSFHLLELNAHQETAPNGVNLQQYAREKRYAFFEQLMQENAYAATATAHHLNDSSETMLFNLAMGTGVRGLTGIPAKRDRYIRPLLFAEKQEILAFAQENGLEWREDQSNQQTKYRRNFIRQEVIPKLEELNPAFQRSMRQNAQGFKQVAQMMVWAKAYWFEYCCEQKGEDLHIDVNPLRLTGFMDWMLFEWLKPYGLKPKMLGEVLKLLEVRSGAYLDLTNHRLFHRPAGLLLSPLPPQQDHSVSWFEDFDRCMMTSGKYLEKEDAKKWPNFKDLSSKEIYVDAEKLEWPLEIRSWKQGDRFQPFGMHGKSQLLSDFFINQKLAQPEKERVRLLVSKGEIVWVIGFRVDHRFALTGSMNSIQKISLCE